METPTREEYEQFMAKEYAEEINALAARAARLDRDRWKQCETIFVAANSAAYDDQPAA